MQNWLWVFLADCCMCEHMHFYIWRRVQVWMWGGGVAKSFWYPEVTKQQILCQTTGVDAMFVDSEPIFPRCVYVHTLMFVSVCGQQAVVPMVVCYWLVISVGTRSCYQAWHGDRRGWMMHGTGKLFGRKDNGATHTHSSTHPRPQCTHTYYKDRRVCTGTCAYKFLHTQ